MMTHLGYSQTRQATEQLVSEFSSCLLIDNGTPIQLSFELLLRKRFPDLIVKRLFIKQPFLAAQLANIAWQSYDFVLVSSAEVLACLSEWLPETKTDVKEVQPPLIMVLTEDNADGIRALMQGADAYMLLNCIGSEFSARLDMLLEVRRYLCRYPLGHFLGNNGYRALEVLHRSENSVLFRLEDNSTHESVVKRFIWDVSNVSETVFQDFLATALQLRQLEHPNIIRLYAAYADKDGVYIHMEYIQGSTLKELLSFGLLPPLGERLAWFKAILSAVAAMHSLGLVHGDLKASNIMLNEQDEPVLLDFGIEVQLLHAVGFLDQDEIYGTPYYLNPERILREAGNDEQADIYALGVLFYELLTGNKPYEGRTLKEVLSKHVLAPIPDLPVELYSFQPLLNQLMAKLPEQRPVSVEEILAFFECDFAGERSEFAMVS